jgi:alkanesulfonate monooxygenase SsuD/methylene tetrahydromethanopterin reductase-like flavin-dependent oxidoreductase (luciferase family)
MRSVSIRPLPANVRDEHLQIIGKAFTQEKLVHKGTHYDFPERRIAPWPAGRRPVPVHLSTTSLESHAEAGAMGVGAMSGLSILGWDYLQACVDAYRAGACDAKPVAGAINRRQAVLSMGVNCHHDRVTAIEVTRDNSLRFLEVIMNWMTRLAKRSDGYAYFAQIEKLKENMTNFEFLIDTGPYFMVGTPDDIIGRCRRMYDMGIDDVVWRIDGMGHENNMKALKMIGDHVLPQLHSWPEHEASTPSFTWET